ncbi:hypothetical protein K502DRAFT_367857 [Neoconidiobolus thromboides FSU 785]|nr:hypothetical protein K502DRAFT_367857 [Neoconidiobolus thromboides FSU 785]
MEIKLTLEVDNSSNSSRDSPLHEDTKGDQLEDAFSNNGSQQENSSKKEDSLQYNENLSSLTESPESTNPIKKENQSANNKDEEYDLDLNENLEKDDDNIDKENEEIRENKNLNDGDNPSNKSFYEEIPNKKENEQGTEIEKVNEFKDSQDHPILEKNINKEGYQGDNALDINVDEEKEPEIKDTEENNISEKNIDAPLSPISSISTSRSSNSKPKRKTRKSSPVKKSTKTKTRSSQNKDSYDNDGLSESDPSQSPDPSLKSDKISKMDGKESKSKMVQKEAVAVVKKLEADFSKLKAQIYQEKFTELTKDVEKIQNGTSELLYERTKEARIKRARRIRLAAWNRKYALWESASQLSAQQYSIDTQFLYDRFNTKGRIHNKFLKEKWKVQEAKIISEMQQSEFEISKKLTAEGDNHGIVNSIENDEYEIEKIEDLKKNVQSLNSDEINEDILKMRGYSQRTGFSPLVGVGESFDMENIILNIKIKNPRFNRNILKTPAYSTSNHNYYNVNPRETINYFNPKGMGMKSYYPHSPLHHGTGGYSPPNRNDMISPQLEPPTASRRTKVKIIGNDILLLDESSHSVGDRFMVNDNLHAASFPARLAGIGNNEITMQKFDGAKTKIQLTALSTGRYSLNVLPDSIIE